MFPCPRILRLLSVVYFVFTLDINLLMISMETFLPSLFIPTSFFFFLRKFILFSLFFNSILTVYFSHMSSTVHLSLFLILPQLSKESFASFFSPFFCICGPPSKSAFFFFSCATLVIWSQDSELWPPSLSCCLGELKADPQTSNILDFWRSSFGWDEARIGVEISTEFFFIYSLLKINYFCSDSGAE